MTAPRAARRRDRCPTHSFGGDGLSTCSWAEHDGQRGVDVVWPARTVRVLCYAVTGISEGRYAHVDLFLREDGDPAPPGVAWVRHLPAFYCKTFGGFEDAWAIARELARLLGA